MTVLTAEQVAAAAYIGGWRNSEIVEAVATSFGESSFNTKAISYTGCCYGLWQINKSAHEKLFATGKWDNPADNAKMGYQIYREAGGSWQPWSAHGGGQYKLGLPKAKLALEQLTADLKSGKTAEQILGSTSTNGSGNTNVEPAGITDTLKALTNPHTYIRAGIILIGVLLLTIGLVAMLSKSKTVKSAANTTLDIIPETRVAKVAVQSAKAVTR